MSAGAIPGENASVLSLTVPAKADYLVLGRLVLTGLSHSYPLDPDTLSDLKLALTEACSNSIRHAYEGTEGLVHVRYEITEESVTIEVSDDGPGFEPLDGDGVRTAPEDGGDALDEGGLGLAIIRAVTDEVVVERPRAGHGSRVRFVRRLHSAPSED